jgi:ATP synthase protein I
VATVAPRASMMFALMTYTLQVLLLAMVLVAVSRSDLAPDTLDLRWLAGSVIAGTLVWMAALLVGALRSDLGSDQGAGGGSGGTSHPTEVVR